MATCVRSLWLVWRLLLRTRSRGPSAADAFGPSVISEAKILLLELPCSLMLLSRGGPLQVIKYHSVSDSLWRFLCDDSRKKHTLLLREGYEVSARKLPTFLAPLMRLSSWSPSGLIWNGYSVFLVVLSAAAKITSRNLGSPNSIRTRYKWTWGHSGSDSEGSGFYTFPVGTFFIRAWEAISSFLHMFNEFNPKS